MTVAGFAIGAAKGLVYLRGEYLYLLEELEAVLRRRREAGLLGSGILGRAGFDFDIEIHLGAGAYICGEESALIESLEGKPGKPRNRPPYPDTCGYLSQPTIVNNVETYACAAKIAERGGAWFASLGTPQSAGTKLFSVSGDVKRPGVYEYPFGDRYKDSKVEIIRGHIRSNLDDQWSMVSLEALGLPTRRHFESPHELRTSGFVFAKK